MAIRELRPAEQATSKAGVTLGVSLASSAAPGGPYFVGQEVELRAEIHRPDGILVDPSAVACRVIDGEGNEQTYTPEREEIGVYSQRIVTTCSGTWRYRFVGTGRIVVAGQKTFAVKAKPFAA